MSNKRARIRREIIEYMEEKRRGNYATLDVSPLNTVFPTLMKIAFFSGSYLDGLHESDFLTRAIKNKISRQKGGSVSQILDALALDVELDVYTLTLKHEAMGRVNSYEYADGYILFSNEFLRRLKNTVDYDGAWFSGLVTFCKCASKSKGAHFAFFDRFDDEFMDM